MGESLSTDKIEKLAQPTCEEVYERRRQIDLEEYNPADLEKEQCCDNRDLLKRNEDPLREGDKAFKDLAKPSFE